ncbi:beta-1,6-N-acetylglucosaminyltransferase [Telluria mixta]|uniref:Peptide O-xylosyltransferase n=1 Tax=Telluria mixta TaxID=34071 RepID=A0ABT2C7W3_9BURK|nr:beta-1,6-N-acetylglucosaminyltransferase [Telluria mixta]MCS0633490.1 beta-1,6-N-acetylglucosaminyltransferase [Telluria mixta]WEM96241.1 beta-1,6-N-acetylglucosaminyltransferase [Telluria mixta]
MTTQVFLIQAHKDLDQLNALVEQLRDDDFRVYVNLDRKCALDPAAVHPAARLVQDRVDVHWGTFSQVQAVLNSLHQIVAEVPEFDKVIFLSAQDFPLLSNARLKEALARHAHHELLDTVAIGTEPGQWAAGFRYQYFYRDDGPRLLRTACRIANRAMRAAGITRRLPGGMRPYGGSSWWALSRACVQDILARVARDPGLVRFFRRCACPDEMFFQTLVMNSPFAPRVLGQNFRYVQWPEHGARNPKILDEGDFERIAASRAHFCRKIDSEASAALLPRLHALRAA